MKDCSDLIKVNSGECTSSIHPMDASGARELLSWRLKVMQFIQRANSSQKRTGAM